MVNPFLMNFVLYYGIQKREEWRTSAFTIMSSISEREVRAVQDFKAKTNEIQLALATLERKMQIYV